MLSLPEAISFSSPEIFKTPSTLIDPPSVILERSPPQMLSIQFPNDQIDYSILLRLKSFLAWNESNVDIDDNFYDPLAPEQCESFLKIKMKTPKIQSLKI